MATERLSMRQIREILRRKTLTRSHRQVASGLAVSLGTVTGVLRRATHAGLEWPHVQSLTDDALETSLYGAPTTPWATRPLPDCAYLHTERRKPDEMQKLGYTFRSTGDTEVLLCTYAACGEECLDRLNGMWAFLKYDADKRIVFGSRYRFGVKPLYRYQDGERVLFALEIKAIVSSGYYSGATNWGVASSFLIQGRLENTDETFYQDIVKVPAASAFEKRLSGKVGPGLLSKICEVDPL